jgi:hypothetical protein
VKAGGKLEGQGTTNVDVEIAAQKITLVNEGEIKTATATLAHLQLYIDATSGYDMDDPEGTEGVVTLTGTLIADYA